MGSVCWRILGWINEETVWVLPQFGSKRRKYFLVGVTDLEVIPDTDGESRRVDRVLGGPFTDLSVVSEI